MTRWEIDMEERKITTEYDPKPIPIRTWDWTATFDGYSGPGDYVGSGATEHEAIENLMEVFLVLYIVECLILKILFHQIRRYM